MRLHCYIDHITPRGASLCHWLRWDLGDRQPCIVPLSSFHLSPVTRWMDTPSDVCIHWQHTPCNVCTHLQHTPYGVAELYTLQINHNSVATLAYTDPPTRWMDTPSDVCTHLQCTPCNVCTHLQHTLYGVAGLYTLQSTTIVSPHWRIQISQHGMCSSPDHCAWYLYS